MSDLRLIIRSFLEFLLAFYPFRDQNIISYPQYPIGSNLLLFLFIPLLHQNWHVYVGFSNVRKPAKIRQLTPRSLTAAKFSILLFFCVCACFVLFSFCVTFSIIEAPEKWLILPEDIKLIKKSLLIICPKWKEQISAVLYQTSWYQNKVVRFLLRYQHQYIPHWVRVKRIWNTA